MLSLIVQSVILIVLLKTCVDEDASLLSAVLLTLATLLAMSGLIYLLLPLGGILALLLGGTLAAVGLGAAISFIYASPLKTATLVSVIFLVSCIIVSLGFQFLFRL